MDHHSGGLTLTSCPLRSSSWRFQPPAETPWDCQYGLPHQKDPPGTTSELAVKLSPSWQSHGGSNHLNSSDSQVLNLFHVFHVLTLIPSQHETGTMGRPMAPTMCSPGAEAQSGHPFPWFFHAVLTSSIDLLILSSSGSWSSFIVHLGPLVLENQFQDQE